MAHVPQTSDTVPQPPLTHIAERLGKAAVTLTEAAQALSAAAKLLTPGHSKPPAQQNVETQGLSGAHPMVSYESDTGSSPTEAESGRADGDASGLLRNDSRSELYTNPEDTSYYGSDRGDNQPEHSGSLAGEPAPADESCVGPTESKSSTNPDRAYHMLVDHEVDVLLFTCGVIGRSQKVVCYMCCSVLVLYIFQKLISEITETPVLTISKVTPTELERAGAEFLSQERSVILLPESVAPRMVLDGKGTCVVHVGWPAKESLYESQLKAHQAEDNVVIAYTEDRDLYPAGATIVQRSEPWPGNTELFQISIAILRPLFDQKLAELSYHLKGKIYPEWINFHGPNGQRHVTSWTPSVLVHRANTYLLDVLRYDILRFNPNDVEYALQVSLPEVSSGFVKTNGLESAVEEGILRVAKTNSGLNHMSSLSRGDFIPTATTSMNEMTPAGSQRPTRPNSGLDFYSQSNIIPTTSVEPKTFLPTSGYTYFALEEEFDAIPLLCFLAVEHPTERVIIFLDDLGCLPHYQKLVKYSINKITGRMVMVAQGTTSEEQAQSNQNAALAFIACSTPMILLLPYRLSKLPPALENSTVGCCVYWGAGDFVALSQAQRNNARLKSNTTHIIMTTVQRDSRRSTIKVSEHPSSPELANFGSSSWLSPMRETARSVLANNQQIARGLYGAYCYFFGKVPRNVASAEEVAHQLNRYSARILLRGKAEDGSARFPPISGGFQTPAKLVKAFDLQPAVDARLLTVG